MRITASLCPMALLAIVGCSSQPAIDLDAERAALMSVDRDWYEAYAASDTPADAFVSKMVDDASLLPPDAPMAEGKDAIHGVITMLEGLPGFSVSWSPAEADVGSGGDLGYTRGTYEINMDGPDGQITINGKYITIWKKQADGTWMVTEDMFNQDAPTPPM